MISIKTSREIAAMAECGKLLALVMARVKKEVKSGVMTKEIDGLAERLILECGGQPSFKLAAALGGGGFPTAACVSVNDEVVHGVPSTRIIDGGDLVSLDIGMIYKGFHTDMAVTVAVGEAAPEMRRLVRIAKKTLKYAIKKARPGNTFGDVGNTIERYVESQGFAVVRDLCGHGIGSNLHEDPQILNYGKRHKGLVIKEGMTFCIEPMITAGDPKIVLGANKLTYRTKDGNWAAHFEHTLAVYPDGCRILTKTGDDDADESERE